MGWFNHQPVIFRGVFPNLDVFSRWLREDMRRFQDSLLQEAFDKGATEAEKFRHGSCWYTRSYGIDICNILDMMLFFVELDIKRKDSKKQPHDIFLDDFSITKHQKPQDWGMNFRAPKEVSRELSPLLLSKGP